MRYKGSTDQKDGQSARLLLPRQRREAQTLHNWNRNGPATIERRIRAVCIRNVKTDCLSGIACTGNIGSLHGIARPDHRDSIPIRGSRKLEFIAIKPSMSRAYNSIRSLSLPNTEDSHDAGGCDKHSFHDRCHIRLSFQACSATETAKPGFDPTHRQSMNCQHSVTAMGGISDVAFHSGLARPTPPGPILYTLWSIRSDLPTAYARWHSPLRWRPLAQPTAAPLPTCVSDRD